MEDCCYGWRWRATAMAGNGGLLLWPEMKPPTFVVVGDGGLRDMRLFMFGEAWVSRAGSLYYSGGDKGQMDCQGRKKAGVIDGVGIRRRCDGGWFLGGC
ncbi:hypothetical protein L1887_28806 [Cichorium endivia]|nr:hypothetical protein L1887_28806 [Cichorium endivia]